MLVDSPAFADEHLEFILATGEADNSDARGRRVWWRKPVQVSDQDELPFSDFYMSLTPGEIRTKPPEGADDVIREAPLRDPPRTFSTLLRQAIERFSASPPPTGSKLERLVVAARRVLAEAQGEPDATVLEEFRRMSDDYLAHQVTDPAARLGRLREFYESYAIAGALFVPAMAILRAELGTGCWPDEDMDIWANPKHYALGFLASIWRNNPDRCAALVEVANGSFAEAETELSAAFDAPTHLLFLRRLYSACALSLEACYYAITIEREGGLRTLDYSAQLADEHFAWGMTGLSFGVPEVSKVTVARERRYFAALIRSGHRERVERELDERTSLTKPEYYRAGAKLELAWALIDGGLPWAKDAFAILDELQATLAEVGIFVPGYWDQRDALDLARMRAHRACGDEESANSLAYAIASREVMSWTLGA